MYSEASRIQEILDAAQSIVIVQADNPDGDSLGSALALEQILHELGKEPTMFCAVDIPGYLRYLDGWDRVEKDLPKKFDASIIVDASTLTLLEKLSDSGQKSWLASKPCVVLDHHSIVERPIDFASVTLNDPTRAATGELIYVLATELNWPLSIKAQNKILTAILGDTQGLTNQLTSADTYHFVGNMIAAGVDRPALEERRRELSKMPAEIFKYKARLIAHTEFASEGTIASVTVPQVEINLYSPLYNPGPLIQTDMLQTQDVRIAIVFKTYDDGKVTAAIRCNPPFGIAAKLAEKFGGGGHAFASGFKIETGRPFNEIKSECLAYATELLTNAQQDLNDATIQHTD